MSKDNELFPKTKGLKIKFGKEFKHKGDIFQIISILYLDRLI
jgi:hypothetical protein